MLQGVRDTSLHMAPFQQDSHDQINQLSSLGQKTSGQAAQPDWPFQVTHQYLGEVGAPGGIWMCL